MQDTEVCNPMTFSRPSFSRLRLAMVGTVLGLAFLTPNAFASCTYPTAKQAFARWNDPAFYVPAPNGGLEAGSANWSLYGAGVVSGNEPFYLNGYGSHSLRIPDGASATSPALCVSTSYPTFRFMVRNTGNASATLRVDVLYLDSNRQLARKTAGYLTAGSTWAPSRKLAIALGLTGVSSTGSASLRIQFVPTGGGSFQVDDLLVDPWCRA